MKAGFIGYRNFARKLRTLFENSGRVGKYIFFHPEKALEELTFTNKLNDLFECDFIVIASPDLTHGGYLRQLKDYCGYIFCEKVPVMDKKDLQFLMARRNPLLYFDFNFRKSMLFDIFREQRDKLLYISHRMCHGLALKREYEDSWRSKAEYAPLGVFQLSGIHLFDLLIFCFGRPSAYRVKARNISPYGDSVDNFGIWLEFGGGIIADMFFSYTSPYQYRLDIVTTEQLVEYDGQDLIVRGPRETFDENGLFSTPPIITRRKVNIYRDSLKSSVDYFLKVVESAGKFEETSAQNNLLSTELFLDILDGIEVER